MKNVILILIALLSIFQLNAQMHQGKIVFERRTNLEKRFNDPRMKKFVTEDNKIKNEKFVLYFNDTLSAFKPILSDEPDPTSWMTTKNSYYMNQAMDQKMSILSLFGQDIYIKDSMPVRAWKITESTRKIANYNCIKAIYQKDDSTRLYAWFSLEIVPAVGPEGFCGLPGAILGLATEDGGIIYFAKSVESTPPTKEDLAYKETKSKVFTMQEFKEKIEKDYGNQPWGKRIFADLFRWL